MNTLSKIVISVLSAIVVVLYAYILFHSGVTKLVAAPSPTGTTGTTQFVAQQVFLNSTTTWASFFNGGGDRIISDVYTVNIAGGTTTVTLQLATSSTPDAIRDVNGSNNTNLIFSLLTGSSTSYMSTSSTNQMSNTPAVRIWPTGSYLDFSGATGTMTGVIGVRYFQD